MTTKEITIKVDGQEKIMTSKGQITDKEDKLTPETLSELIESFKVSADKATILKAYAYYYKYSENNILALASQGASGTCQGFQQWEKEGLSIAKGSKSYKIFVPLRRKASKKEEEKNKNEYVCYGFKLASVFTSDQLKSGGCPEDDFHELNFKEMLAIFSDYSITQLLMMNLKEAATRVAENLLEPEEPEFPF